MIPLTCPQCGKGYQVRDSLAGKTGRCAQCQATFTVPQPQTAVATAFAGGPTSHYAGTHAHAAVPAGRLGEPLDPRWHTVRTGLTVSRIGLILLLCGTAVFALLTLWLSSTRGTLEQTLAVLQAANVLMSLALPLMLFGPVAIVTGWFICSDAPTRSGGRGWATAAGALACAGFIVAIVISALPSEQGSRGGKGLEALLGVGLRFAILGGFAAALCYARFLAVTATSLGKRGVAVSASLFSLLVAFNVVMSLFLAFAPPMADSFVQIMFRMIAVVLPLVLLIWQLMLVNQVRHAVRKHIGKAGTLALAA